jgi:hypothetical protein
MKSIVYHTNEQLIAALEQIQRPEKGKL